MKIRRNHWFVKLAFLFNGMEPPRYGKHGLPYQIRLCPLFWRAVLNTAGSLGFIGLVLTLACLIAYKLWHVTRHEWFLFFVFASLMLATFAIVYGPVKLFLKFRVGRKIADAAIATTEAISESVVWQAAKSVKSTMCPVIEFTE